MKLSIGNLYVKDVVLGEENSFKDGETVNAATLIEKGIIKNEFDGVKILAKGELTKKLTVEAKAFSGKAKEAIESVGGTAKVIE